MSGTDGLDSLPHWYRARRRKSNVGQVLPELQPLSDDTLPSPIVSNLPSTQLTKPIVDGENGIATIVEDDDKLEVPMLLRLQYVLALAMYLS